MCTGIDTCRLAYLSMNDSSRKSRCACVHAFIFLGLVTKNVMRETTGPTICVVPLTADLARRLREEASDALTGDGSCSLHAMRTSCFASELCTHGGREQISSMDLESMLHMPHAFVAIATHASDPRQHFVGCVSAMDARHSVATSLFPHHPFCDGALVLGNLCVADAYRKHGVGRSLVNRILETRTPEVYLLIARGEDSPNPAVVATFRDRVNRLRSTYHRLDFEPMCDCSRAILLRHRGVRLTPTTASRGASEA